MSTKSYNLLFSLIALIDVGMIRGSYTKFFEFGDQNLDHYLTLDEFNEAKDADPNWKKDAYGMEALIKYNGRPVISFRGPLAKTCGLEKEDFYWFIRERSKGRTNYKSFSGTKIHHYNIMNTCHHNNIIIFMILRWLQQLLLKLCFRTR